MCSSDKSSKGSRTLASSGFYDFFVLSSLIRRVLIQRNRGGYKVVPRAQHALSPQSEDTCLKVNPRSHRIQTINSPLMSIYSAEKGVSIGRLRCCNDGCFKLRASKVYRRSRVHNERPFVNSHLTPRCTSRPRQDDTFLAPKSSI
jgi:hypothetical protein